MGDARSELIDALAEYVGVAPLTPAEIESVLSLAAVAAHGTGDRTTAPLASFLAASPQPARRTGSSHWTTLGGASPNSRRRSQRPNSKRPTTGFSGAQTRFGLHIHGFANQNGVNAL